MKDKNNLGLNSEDTSPETPTPKFNTGNPPTKSGQYPKSAELQKEIQEKITGKVFNPKEKVDRVPSPLRQAALESDLKERETLYPQEANDKESYDDVFSLFERERAKLSSIPLTPPPEQGVDIDRRPRESDTNRPPSAGFSVPAKSAKELSEADQRNDNRPTPIPDGQNRKVSGQFQAQNIYEDAGFAGTPRFAAPKTPQGDLLKNLERSATRTKVRTDIFPEDENIDDSTYPTIIDKINNGIKE